MTSEYSTPTADKGLPEMEVYVGDGTGCVGGPPLSPLERGGSGEDLISSSTPPPAGEIQSKKQTGGESPRGKAEGGEKMRHILREIEEIFEDLDGVKNEASYFTVEQARWDKERGLLIEFDNSWVNDLDNDLDSDIYYDVVAEREALVERWEDEMIELIRRYNLSFEELNEYFERLWE